MTTNEIDKQVGILLQEKDFKVYVKTYKKHYRNDIYKIVDGVFYSVLPRLYKYFNEVEDYNVSELCDWIKQPCEDSPDLTVENAIVAALIAKV